VDVDPVVVVCRQDRLEIQERNFEPGGKELQPIGEAAVRGGDILAPWHGGQYHGDLLRKLLDQVLQNPPPLLLRDPVLPGVHEFFQPPGAAEAQVSVLDHVGRQTVPVKPGRLGHGGQEGLEVVPVNGAEIAVRAHEGPGADRGVEGEQVVGQVVPGDHQDDQMRVDARLQPPPEQELLHRSVPAHRPVVHGQVRAMPGPAVREEILLGHLQPVGIGIPQDQDPGPGSGLLGKRSAQPERVRATAGPHPLGAIHALHVGPVHPA
jgi:hypothetical protein